MFENLVLSPNTILLLGFLGVAPFILISTTSFVKLAVVFSLIRNALGVQQIPPNMVIYGLALIITFYIMLPVGIEILEIVNANITAGNATSSYFIAALEPLSTFLERHADERHVEFFKENISEIWGTRFQPGKEVVRFMSLLPAFTISELSDAFKIGFLIYLPFIAIDLVVSNILLALGMMMLSPVTISLPFKLFLFVAVDGWTRLVHSLVLSYL